MRPVGVAVARGPAPARLPEAPRQVDAPALGDVARIPSGAGDRSIDPVTLAATMRALAAQTAQAQGAVTRARAASKDPAACVGRMVNEAAGRLRVTLANYHAARAHCLDAPDRLAALAPGLADACRGLHALLSSDAPLAGLSSRTRACLRDEVASALPDLGVHAVPSMSLGPVFDAPTEFPNLFFGLHTDLSYGVAQQAVAALIGGGP